MKTFGLAFVLLFFVNSIIFSQSSDIKQEDRVYLKGGYQRSFHVHTGYIPKGSGSREKRSYYTEDWYNNFYGGIGYRYTNKISFEVMYEFIDDIGYADKQVRGMKMNPPENLYSYVFSEFSSHEMTLRSIIFVNNDRTEDPVYFTAGITFTMQPVNNRFIDEYEDGHIFISDSYNRFAAGPLAGVGIYWDFGPVGVTTEFTFGSKVSIFRKGLSETSIKLSISPVLKL